MKVLNNCIHNQSMDLDSVNTLCLSKSFMFSHLSRHSFLSLYPFWWQSALQLQVCFCIRSSVFLLAHWHWRGYIKYPGILHQIYMRNIWAVRIVSYFRRPLMKPCALTHAFVLKFVWSLAESVKRRATHIALSGLPKSSNTFLNMPSFDHHPVSPMGVRHLCFGSLLLFSQMLILWHDSQRKIAVLFKKEKSDPLVNTLSVVSSKTRFNTWA